VTLLIIPIFKGLYLQLAKYPRPIIQILLRAYCSGHLGFTLFIYAVLRVLSFLWLFEIITGKVHSFSRWPLEVTRTTTKDSDIITPPVKNIEMCNSGRVDCCLMFLGVSSVVGPSAVGASPGDKKSKNKSMRGKKKSIFETYMSKEDVSEGLKRGTLIQVLKAYRLFNP
jgi:hypothetical protein